TLQALSRLDVDWPATLAIFFKYVNLLSLPAIGAFLQINMECWTGASVFWEVATQALSPIMVFVDFLLLHGLSLLCSDGLAFNFVHNVIGLIFTKMNISVIGLSLALFYRETMPNSKVMVKAFPEVEFGGDVWWDVLPLNLLTTLFYGVTLFSYVCWIVWTAPRRSMMVPGFIARYRFCFGSVRPDRFWWVIVQLTYGTVINLTQVVFPARNLRSQVYFLLLTMIFFSIIQFRAWPLKFRDCNWVDLTFKLCLVVFLIMTTAWIDTSSMDENDMKDTEVVYSVIIMVGFIWAGSFAAYHFVAWLISCCYPSGFTQGRLTQTVWNLRDVSGAMLMLQDRDLVKRLMTLGEHDLGSLREATNTMIHVFFGKQTSLHSRRQQRMIMGGGFRAWDHNATVIQLLKEDTESGLLEAHVLQRCRFRLSLLKLSRAALAENCLNSYHDHAELYPRVHKNLVLNRRAEAPAALPGSGSSPLPRSSPRSSPRVDDARPTLTQSRSTASSLSGSGSSSLGLGASGTSSSGLGKSSSRSLGLGASGSFSSKFIPKGVRNHLDAKQAARAIQFSKGELTREVFVDMIEKKFGYLHLPTEHVNEMFSSMDADNSGTVSMSEFIGYMMANTPHDLVHHFSKDMSTAWEAAGAGAEGVHHHDFLAMVHRDEVRVWRDSSHMLGEHELDALPLGDLLRAPSSPWASPSSSRASPSSWASPSWLPPPPSWALSWPSAPPSTPSSSPSSSSSSWSRSSVRRRPSARRAWSFTTRSSTGGQRRMPSRAPFGGGPMKAARRRTTSSTWTGRRSCRVAGSTPTRAR
ncbi:unnamed protein product, partial [Prorocentrum cordatum]